MRIFLQSVVDKCMHDLHIGKERHFQFNWHMITSLKSDVAIQIHNKNPLITKQFNLYDINCYQDVKIEPIWRQMSSKFAKQWISVTRISMWCDEQKVSWRGSCDTNINVIPCLQQQLFSTYTIQMINEIKLIILVKRVLIVFKTMAIFC